MRIMNIQEATKASLETGKLMVRKDDPFNRKGKTEIRINPTDGPDCCVIHVVKKRERGQAAEMLESSSSGPHFGRVGTGRMSFKRGAKNGKFNCI